MTTTSLAHDARQVAPWYRQPWLWFVASWPIAAIVGGIATTYIAFSGADGLVADDYYKRGLAINRELSRDHAAERLQLIARARYDAERGRVTVALSSPHSHQWPPTITLRLVHPTQAQGDRRIVLAADERGTYTSNATIESGLRWRFSVESDAWRLVGLWAPDARGEVELHSHTSQ